MSSAYAPASIQDAPDGPGLLTSSDDGKFMMWDNAAGRMIMATVRASGVAGAVLRTGNGSLQRAPDGPGVMAAGNDGMALLWNNAAGRFVATAVEAAGAVAAHVAAADPHAGYLLATGARTGASDQAQTFTNGIVGPTWKPASDSTTAIQILNTAGSAIVNVDTTNQRVGISQTTPAGKLHVVKTPLTNASNAHRDTSNSTILLESSDAVVQLIADDAGISAGGILLSQVPSSGDNKHWLLSGMGPSRSNRFQICYGATSTGGNVFGTVDLTTPIVVITTGGNVGVGGITAPTALVHTGASTTARASICQPHGVAPTSPVNGDEWTTTAGKFLRINGVTKTVVTVSSPATYTPSNVTTDRTYDANATTLDELADIVGTLIADLKLTGIIL